MIRLSSRGGAGHLLALCCSCGLAMLGCSSAPEVVLPEPAVDDRGTAVTPSLQELLDAGVEETGARCFRAEPDPTESGTYTDPTGTLFLQAFDSCFEQANR